jgi:DNA-binding Xre family transcriptional regulator
MAEFQYINLGAKIEEVLSMRYWTKTELGEAIGMSQSNAVYLTKKKSIDVVTLHKMGVALKYDFFKHYPIEEEGEKNKVVAEWQAKIAELEKQAEQQKIQMDILKQENGYLKEINELLKRGLK